MSLLSSTLLLACQAPGLSWSEGSRGKNQFLRVAGGTIGTECHRVGGCAVSGTRMTSSTCGPSGGQLKERVVIGIRVKEKCG